MCKNANNPCPGCKKYAKADTYWMFFTEEERLSIVALKNLQAPVDQQPQA